jgi:DNA/RNA-binding domain of Phe-tRNA-synthetase-like protein
MNCVAALPMGQRIALGSDVIGALRCGIVVAEDVEIAPSGPALQTEIEARCGLLRGEHAHRQPADIPGLQAARRLYRAVGMDPTRHRPSSEALLRRVLKGHSLYEISNAVDACNLASLCFLLPIGLYDLDLIQGDVTLRLGAVGEEYPGIRKGPVHLQGRLGLFDERGPFGSPTSDSARTCVGPATRRLLGIIMTTAEYPAAAMHANVQLMADLYTRHCGAAIGFQGLLGWEAPPC